MTLPELFTNLLGTGVLVAIAGFLMIMFTPDEAHEWIKVVDVIMFFGGFALIFVSAIGLIWS